MEWLLIKVHLGMRNKLLLHLFDDVESEIKMISYIKVWCTTVILNSLPYVLDLLIVNNYIKHEGDFKFNIRYNWWTIGHAKVEQIPCYIAEAMGGRTVLLEAPSRVQDQETNVKNIKWGLEKKLPKMVVEK